MTPNRTDATHPTGPTDSMEATDALLRKLLQQTVATPPGPELQRVQHNALSTWHAHRVQTSPQQLGQMGQMATLGRASVLWQRPGTWGWLVLAAALCVAVGLRPTLDANLADLQQPDVLSQIMLDDL